MNKLALLSSFIILQACAQKPWHGDLNYLGKFTNNLSEVSGIVSYNKKLAWVIEDNGNKDHIYAINLKAGLVKDLNVKDAKNQDWEDLATDKSGNLYIGDFGNNDNKRKDLTIYKLPNPELEKGDKIPSEKITFHYPEQKKFPPKKSNQVYDSEAFFHWDKHLYIFTKDRSRPYLGKTLIYQIPDKKGNYKAKLVGTINLCNDQDHCSVTGADISNDGKTIALIGYGYLYLGKNFDVTVISETKFDAIYLRHETQIESVCFLDDTTLLIADEQSKTKGRNLYSYEFQ
ncbi:hypothetical protein [Croceitalea rosinachiae]|uniref:SdiA-regulated n=1 Tax=Croceitalea rosinachiae TaxID=3075596 RepID=A0ABU3A925_9FLAO|nr:hypothetical protein [Croceitalea sp. F388]MDT0606686.1 hypothetical protein [Croceitalea sp. F388]